MFTGIGCMAKHVRTELDLRMSATFPAKFVKRSHNDSEVLVRSSESTSPVTDAAAIKCPRDTAVAVVPRPLTSHQLPANYVVTRSEMMTFFSLLGNHKILLHILAALNL